MEQVQTGENAEDTQAAGAQDTGAQDTDTQMAEDAGQEQGQQGPPVEGQPPRAKPVVMSLEDTANTVEGMRQVLRELITLTADVQRAVRAASKVKDRSTEVEMLRSEVCELKKANREFEARLSRYKTLQETIAALADK